MKAHLTLASILLGVGLLGNIFATARADTIDPTLDDPLHGYCSVGCVDNGTNSPTTQNPISGFGFTISPGPQTGNLTVDVLVPDNLVSMPSSLSFAITGTLTGTANLFSATAWTSGFLASYLGLNASPANPIGAYLPSTQALDLGATGFYVYQVDLGHITLEAASDPNISPLEDIGALPLASYIVGFLTTSKTTCDKKHPTICTTTYPTIATANSGAIFETGFPPNHGGGNTPLPGALLLMGTVLAGAAGLGGWRKKRKNTIAFASV